MDPKAKIQKNDDDLDIFSTLPDSVLNHILSFLDTKTAIRTSFLSKRYRLPWTMLQSLDFKLPDFHVTENPDSNGGRSRSPLKKSNVDSFENYVNHVLQHREHSNLTSFRLSLHNVVGSDFVQNCVDYAAQHKVQHFRIRANVAPHKSLVLPALLLNSSYLVTLHLNCAVISNIDLPKSVSLPNLKVLKLKKFEFSNENFNGELFSGCPSLEALVLSKCRIRAGIKLVLDVHCLKLKSLVIKNWRSPWRCFDEHSICVNAPGLVFFELRGHLARVTFKQSLGCMDRACVDLGYPTSCAFVLNAIERLRKTAESFVDMLRQLCKVKSLSLSLRTIEIMSALPDLRVHASFLFEHLRVIKFTAEEEYIEKTLPIKNVVRLLERVVTNSVTFNSSKEQKRSYKKRSKTKRKQKARSVAIPANIMQFFVESSPAAEFFTIEIPIVSSDQ